MASPVNGVSANRAAAALDHLPVTTGSAQLLADRVEGAAAAAGPELSAFQRLKEKGSILDLYQYLNTLKAEIFRRHGNDNQQIYQCLYVLNLRLNPRQVMPNGCIKEFIGVIEKFEEEFNSGSFGLSAKEAKDCSMGSSLEKAIIAKTEELDWNITFFITQADQVNQSYNKIVLWAQELTQKLEGMRERVFAWIKSNPDQCVLIKNLRAHLKAARTKCLAASLFMHQTDYEKKLNFHRTLPPFLDRIVLSQTLDRILFDIDKIIGFPPVVEISQPVAAEAADDRGKASVEGPRAAIAAAADAPQLPDAGQDHGGKEGISDRDKAAGVADPVPQTFEDAFTRIQSVPIREMRAKKLLKTLIIAGIAALALSQLVISSYGVLTVSGIQVLQSLSYGGGGISLISLAGLWWLHAKARPCHEVV